MFLFYHRLIRLHTSAGDQKGVLGSVGKPARSLRPRLSALLFCKLSYSKSIDYKKATSKADEATWLPRDNEDNIVSVFVQADKLYFPLSSDGGVG